MIEKIKKQLLEIGNKRIVIRINNISSRTLNDGSFLIVMKLYF